MDKIVASYEYYLSARKRVKISTVYKIDKNKSLKVLMKFDCQDAPDCDLVVTSRSGGSVFFDIDKCLLLSSLSNRGK